MSLPRRAGGPDRREFERLGFHAWYGCRGCGAVVFDWGTHRGACHDHEDQADEAEFDPGEVAVVAGDLAARARAEGNAVVEASAWRQAWAQVREVLRLRPDGTRPAAGDASPGAPLPAAGRAEQWARIDGLIERTTMLRKEWAGW